MKHAALIPLLFCSVMATARSADDVVADFESVPPGRFTKLSTPLGTWTVDAGSAVVNDRFASRGSQCLQLTGGSNTSVTLTLATAPPPQAELVMDAERWTRRMPFTFRIRQKLPTGWQDLYAGDDRVKVGRSFLSQIRVPLEGPVQQLRFEVSSPDGTGVLLDHIRISPATPQKIVGVESVPFVLPLLKGVPHGPLAKLKIETSGRLDPLALEEVCFRLGPGADLLSSAAVFCTGSSSAFRTDRLFGGLSRTGLSPDGQTVRLRGRQTLREGTNYVWVAGTLAADADIDQLLHTTLESVTFSDGTTHALEQANFAQRLGVSLRSAGDDGVNTYRIPGLVTTNRGTLISVYDVRHRSSRDLPGDIDVGMSRSVDGGKSWEPMRIIMDMGEDEAFRFDGIGDPCVLVDRTTGTIWCSATWSHGNRSWVGSQPGLSPEETGQWMLVRSDDDGRTWSAPMNITRQVKRPEWSFLLQGPGRGITMRDGTLVFPAQFQGPPDADDSRQHRLPHSTIVYSRDHGKTWHCGTAAFDDTTESQVVELQDGRLMLNCRYNRGGHRVVMTTDDLGATWQEHTSSRGALREPGACMASLVNVGQERRWLTAVAGDVVSVTPETSHLLFSNPDSDRGRHHLTIRSSRDAGVSWDAATAVLLDEEPSRGYSCLAVLGDGFVGIVYESSQSDLVFQRVPLSLFPDSGR